MKNIIQEITEKLNIKDFNNLSKEQYVKIMELVQNDNPELLMEAANWWIMQHKLDHFEKAVKIKALVLSESSPNLT